MADKLNAPDAPPPIGPVVEEDHLITEGDNGMSRNWLQLIGYILIALIIALIIVFGVRWIYRVFTNNDNGKKTNVTTQNPTGTNQSEQPGASSAPPPPSTSSTNTGSNTTTPTTSGTLPNNGPGDVVKVFLATSIAAGGLHYIISLRRAAKA